MKTTIFKCLPLLLLAACYEPEPYVAAADDDKPSENAGASSQIGTVFPVNAKKQICNPSVSQDPENYPASMLWLNFSGTLEVTAPDTVYNVTSTKAKKVVQHDRLTISDTSGNVRWYLMRDTDAGDCQFQDPEWSTHPNFIASLRAYDKDGSKACDLGNLGYGIISVRISDKKRYVFYAKDKSEFATPHIWVDPAVTEADTSKKDTTLEGFFGTKNVRLVFVNNKQDGIVFRDFANGGKEIELNPPTDAKGKPLTGKTIDSPLISPDGKFIVYNVVDKADETIWDAYIQELSKNSTPIKIEKEAGMMSAPAQPHWFKFGDRLFVVWAEFPPESQMLNNNDFTNESIQDGSAGRTVMREIRLAPGAASDMAMEWVGDIREISSVPMTGGRSPDSKFLATGTRFGFLIELP